MAKIKIYSDLASNTIFFEGAKLTNKAVGEVEALAHPTEEDRVIVKSTRLFKKGSTTEYRVFLKRLNISRIRNKDGQDLTAAPFNLDRDGIITYLNEQFKKPTITEYFEYDATKDRLVAKKDVEVAKNGFFLGEKHKMASGNSNIYFEDLGNKTNSYPIFGEILDQSIPANQAAGAGFNKPKSRIFTDFQSTPLGGTPVNDTAIPYDGDNFFPFNISGVGITTRAAEVVSPTQQLKYEITVNGISVYVQYLEHNGFAVNEDITWYFDQPLDIETGTTLRATIYKISTVNNQEQSDGILQVCEGDATPTRYQTNVLNRFFTDEPIALKSDVDQLLSGSTYKGAYNGSTSTPTLPTGTDALGDFYRVSAAGGGYATGDILVYNGSSYDHIAEGSITQTDLVTSSMRVYDVYVKANYTGSISDGSILYPYGDIVSAITAANDGDTIYLDGIFNITTEIVLPAGKSLTFLGADNTTIQYTTYSTSNGSIMSYTGSNTKNLVFKNIIFKNAGAYGLYLKKNSTVEIRKCKFINNGWNGTGLHTVLSKNVSGVLGYDSTNTELQAFYAGANASNGGAVRLEECTKPLVRECRTENNFRGIRLQDCGINGGGFVIENQSLNNIESGIYLAAGSLGGCQNITVTINYSSYNANNGLLCIGGINNKFSQNEVNGNWNAGFCGWGAANATLRDCGLYDNNRSQYNGIGNTGDAKASIQINEAYNYLGTTISANSNYRFIAEILDTQVHYTGLGSNTDKIGFLVDSSVGLLADNDKNIIKVDDVGFIGQDYAVDLSEVDTTNLRLSLGDNSYQSIGEKAVREPVDGYYYELPFSNHSMVLNNVDLAVTNTGNIIVKEGASGATINPYSVNELQALAHGTEIKVILKGSRKIQFIVPVSGCSIDGTMVNSVLSSALVQLNDLFSNTTGFASGGNPVTNFVLSNNNLTLTLQDGTSFTVDVTTLGVDENKFVSSGALNGSNLELTMNDSSVVTINASNMINGSSLPAISNNWFISYGNSAGDQITSASIVTTYENKQPFYNGDFLEKGEEYTWTHDNNGTYILGVYSGAEETSDSLEITYNAKWSQNFKFSRSLGVVRETSVGVDVASRYTSGYTITNNTVFALTYDTDNYLKLYDISNNDRILIGQSNTALVGSNVTISMGGENQPNAKFPVMIKRYSEWTIVHDFDGTEGPLTDGLNQDSVIKSNIAISPGELFMANFNFFGRSQKFGIGYPGASSGNSNAHYDITAAFSYGSSEQIIMANSGEWTFNSNNTYYQSSTGGWWWRNNSTNAGMLSLRYQADNSLELWSEDDSELIATKSIDLDGSDIHFFYGVNEASTVQLIPSISKQTIGAGSQPITSFAPDISDQSFSITEGDSLNVQIALDSGSDIVNIYGEENAPSWAILNQSTGVFTGTAPAYTGSSDTYVISCKAANALGGITSFNITLNVLEITYTNTKSLKFEDGVNSYLGGNASLVTSLERSGNGSGASEAWSIGMWIKRGTSNSGQSLFYYGHNDTTNNGHIEIRLISSGRIRLKYGSSNNQIQVQTSTASGIDTSWNHVLVTYDGGTTGASSGSLSSYYGRFKIFVNGVLASVTNSHQNYGWSGSIVGQNFRFGKYVSGNYPKDLLLNQLVIWDSDQSSNISGIYNSGNTQDMTDSSTMSGSVNTSYLSPDHYYEIETSTSTISDIIGTAHFVGYNFSSTDLVTDAP